MKIDEGNIALDNRKKHKISSGRAKGVKSEFDKHKKANNGGAKNDVLLEKYLNRISVFARRFSNVKLCVYGKSGQKALIAISKICTVWGVEKGDDNVSFWVDGKHLSKIIALLKNLCYHYKIVNIGGVVPKVASLVGRVGITLAVAVFAVAIAIYSLHVKSVNISFVGEENISLRAEVQSLLDDYGVRSGVRFDSVDIDALQSAIRGLKDVSYATCTKEGNRIVVVLKSSLDSDFVLDIGGSSIKAQKRAVVTRVVVEGGTAIKKYGDVVSFDDVIIDGYVEMGEDRISVEARGYAYGIVYYNLARFFPSEEIVSERGSAKRITRLSAFNKTPATPESPYEKYTLETSVKGFGFLIPLKIYTYEFCEIVESRKPCDMNVDDMKAVVFSSLLSEIESTARIKDVHYDVSVSENGTSVQILMEVEERIT